MPPMAWPSHVFTTLPHRKLPSCSMSAAEPPIVFDSTGYGIFHVFQVECTLFKIPTEHFSEHAKFFKVLLSLTENPTSTDDGPIQISDTSVDTFVSVLEWLYRLPFSSTLDKEAWIKIFRFAQAHEMDELQSEALRKLNTFDWEAIEHISFCERYSIDLSWAASSLAKLASRWDPLSAEEESSLELRTCLTIMRLREAAREKIWRVTHGAGLESWPPVIHFGPSGVLSYFAQASRPAPSARCYCRDSVEDSLASDPPLHKEKTEGGSRNLKRHSRFYMTEDSVILSNDIASIRADAGIVSLHTPKLNEINVLLLSPVGIRCLRWIYRQIDITSSTPNEWIEILRFAHSASIPHLKQHAVTALQSTSIEPIQKIRLYEDCDLPLEWVKDSIIQISASESTFQISKFEGFSRATLLLLMECREKYLFERIEKLSDVGESAKLDETTNEDPWGWGKKKGKGKKK
ncbi:hypothetical protein DL96DRAFT_1682956 [Flagelloscypha sp. PMI_526]|nr:hypothetical protein DL96DRAFT_1682956 [Flagelloscypha sp. PMI_526]